jgi:hypothetical protein
MLHYSLIKIVLVLEISSVLFYLGILFLLHWQSYATFF